MTKYTDDPLKENFRTRLKLEIKKRDLTYQQAADKIGVPYGTLKSWIRGEGYPRSGSMVKIDNFLKIRLDDPERIDLPRIFHSHKIYLDDHELTDVEKNLIIEFARTIIKE